MIDNCICGPGLAVTRYNTQDRFLAVLEQCIHCVRKEWASERLTGSGVGELLVYTRENGLFEELRSLGESCAYILALQFRHIMGCRLFFQDQIFLPVPGFRGLY